MPDQAGTSSRDYADGKPRLLNVFASWCGPCVAEIPVLLQLQAMGVEINGVAIHDKPEDLAEGQCHNGKVIAPKPEHRKAQQNPPKGRQ